MQLAALLSQLSGVTASVRTPQCVTGDGNLDCSDLTMTLYINSHKFWELAAVSAGIYWQARVSAIT